MLPFHHCSKPPTSSGAAQARWAGPGQTIHLAGQSVEGGARIGPARPSSFPEGFKVNVVPFRCRSLFL